MKKSTISKLCCPVDQSDLSLQVVGQDVNDNIHEGLLVCATCKRYYPIINGVPIMNPDEFREVDMERGVVERWQNELPTNRIVTDFRIENQ